MVASEQIVFQITMAAIELLAQIMTPLGGRPPKDFQDTKFVMAGLVPAIHASQPQ
jgi:hypothetical protein